MCWCVGRFSRNFWIVRKWEKCLLIIFTHPRVAKYSKYVFKHFLKAFFFFHLYILTFLVKCVIFSFVLWFWKCIRKNTCMIIYSRFTRKSSYCPNAHFISKIFWFNNLYESLVFFYAVEKYNMCLVVFYLNL